MAIVKLFAFLAVTSGITTTLARVFHQDARLTSHGVFMRDEPFHPPLRAYQNFQNPPKFSPLVRRVKGTHEENIFGLTLRTGPGTDIRPSPRRRQKVRKIPKVKAENLEWMLKNVFMYPRSHSTNETAKEVAKNFIVDSFRQSSNIVTKVQEFIPPQFAEMYESSEVPTGHNIIGVLRGSEYGTGNDRPVLVGAHWDTVNFTPGTDDNGSGVAAMLEAARAITHSQCRPRNSIIFAAFDLEEVGSQGSLVFIKDYLMEFLRVKGAQRVPVENFQGAFIMDTIMNFNQSDMSQTFPTDWSLVVPNVYEHVANDKFRGDFLSMIYRQDVDNTLAENFHFHWGKSQHQDKFKLTPIPLMLTADLPEMEILADHLNFLRSDHARFWYMNDTQIPSTFQAVLMTDTGPYRGNMRQCYHSTCDGPQVALAENSENLKFLTKITQVLTDTLVDMSKCTLYES